MSSESITRFLSDCKFPGNKLYHKKGARNILFLLAANSREYLKKGRRLPFKPQFALIGRAVVLNLPLLADKYL